LRPRGKPSTQRLILHRLRLPITPSVTTFSVLLGLSVFFSMLDLTTTYQAVARGMSEGNVLILAVSGALGVGLISALEVTKLIFLVGCGVVCLVGTKMVGRPVATMALLLLAFFVVLQALVSINNLYMLS